MFYDHCTSITEAFKSLNQKNEALIQEKIQLAEKVCSLKEKIN